MLPGPKEHGVYHFVVTIPDRIYPFATTIGGTRVRWRRSYDVTRRRIERAFGPGRYGFKLGMWRQICHVIGAGLFIALATALSYLLWGSLAALPAMFAAAMLAITYQEFWYHPRHYDQLYSKSVIDWMSWGVPMMVYVTIVV